jgi:uncharacterized protein (TIGR02271 family)
MGSRKKNADKVRGNDLGHSNDEERMELREEQLDVQKDRVEAGEVRLRKEVVKEKKTIDVPVSHEEVVIEKHAVGGRQPAEGQIGDDEEIRVPLMEERVRAKKTPVVKEEISLKKQQVQTTEHVSDTVRREEAWIDSTGKSQVRTGAAGSWQGSERRRSNERYRGTERRRAGV